MAHKVIVPPKTNYIPQFLKQRDINSYYATSKNFNGNIQYIFKVVKSGAAYISFFLYNFDNLERVKY
jgi:hypothetical protein